MVQGSGNSSGFKVSGFMLIRAVGQSACNPKPRLEETKEV